jgi:hypothetical protein
MMRLQQKMRFSDIQYSAFVEPVGVRYTFYRSVLLKFTMLEAPGSWSCHSAQNHKENCESF